MARRLIVPTKMSRDTRIPRERVTRQPKIAISTKKVVVRNVFPWRPIIRIIFFSLATATVVWLLNSPIFIVRSIAVQGLKSVQEQDVAKKVPLGKNIWVYPTREVSQRIRGLSPLIADARVYRTFPNSLRVMVAERTLALDWQSADKHYVVGLDGTVIMQSTSEETLVRVIDMSNIEPKPGAQVVTPGFIHFAEQLANSFQSTLGVELDHLEIGDTIFDVTIVAKSGPKILVDSTRSPEAQLKAAKLVIDQFRDDIKQYVDMRVAGKAYYQ